MQRRAAEALRNLAWNNQANKNAIRDAGAIPPLVALIRSNDNLTKQAAIGALSCLDDNPLMTLWDSTLLQPNDAKLIIILFGDFFSFIWLCG